MDSSTTDNASSKTSSIAPSLEAGVISHLMPPKQTRASASTTASTDSSTNPQAMDRWSQGTFGRLGTSAPPPSVAGTTKSDNISSAGAPSVSSIDDTTPAVIGIGVKAKAVDTLVAPSAHPDPLGSLAGKAHTAHEPEEDDKITIDQLYRADPRDLEAVISSGKRAREKRQKGIDNDDDDSE